jgi:hypothetical protein
VGRYLLTACLAPLFVGVSAGGCTDKPPAGTLNLVLTLPPTGDLRPTGMTTVAVAVLHADGSENVTTTPLDDGKFTAGELEKGVPIRIAVELLDNGGTLVGFGKLDEPIIPQIENPNVEIPVRKPIVYVATGGTPHTIDTTRNALDPKYQGAIAQLANTNLVVPIDGVDIAVFSSTGMSRVSTAEHKVVGSPIDLAFGTVNDAAPLPGQRKIAVATSMGLAIVDIDSQKVASMRPLTPPPDRIAIGGDADAGFTAYLLSSRVAPPTGMATCTGTSTVIAVSIDGSAELPTTISSTAAIADIAASGGAVFGADPCAGEVKRLDNGMPKLQMALTGASTLAIDRNRLWAAGSVQSATEGARVLLNSIQLDGSDVQAVKLPPKAEVMTYDLDTKGELSINMHADTEVALDLAVLPGAQRVALITQMNSHRNGRADQFGLVIPPMDSVVNDFVLADTQTGAIVQRIRGKCTLDDHFPSGAQFDQWSCIPITGAEAPAGGEMVPLSVGALYGGR